MSSEQTIRFDPRNVWRTGFILLGVVAIGLLANFLIDDGGGVFFIILMSWFASLAMEPAVGRLAKHMKRGLATGIVMLAIAIFFALFTAAFGNLLFDQIAELIQALPGLLDSAIAWVNQRTNSDYEIVDLWEQLNISPEQSAQYATTVLSGVIGIIGSLAISFFSLFTFALFTFYLSADAPRFRRYLTSLFAAKFQPIATQIWDTTALKTGNYVAARVILAVLNGGTSAIVFWIIGMPSWLALGIWTGLVAQFVPTIGTYIAIALPVLVGLLSGNPWIGVMALIWAVIYQQVENLTLEPKISARAVNVHPAVAFASVMLGAALFGVAGALLAIPVTAMVLSLIDSQRLRHEVVEPTSSDPDPPVSDQKDNS
ncbi:MAG: AI-2E family transporter [Candidatus Nanopelagicales bacterium]|nr:AI-2E family transporter [Candidatus Nanopelagicales bacterium]